MPRPSGAKNKRTVELEELIDSSPLGLVEAYLAILNGDWAKLGYETGTTTKWLPSGIEIEEERITLDHRVSAMKELMKYRYAQKRAVDHTSGGKTLDMRVFDYTSKPKE